VKIAGSTPGRRWLFVSLLAATAVLIALPIAWLRTRPTPRHDCMISLGLGHSRMDYTTRFGCERTTQAISRGGWQARSLPATASVKGFQISCRLHYTKDEDTLIVYRRHSDAVGYEFCKSMAANGWVVDYLPPYTLQSSPN
jgi:hypothetical protein